MTAIMDRFVAPATKRSMPHAGSGIDTIPPSLEVQQKELSEKLAEIENKNRELEARVYGLEVQITRMEVTIKVSNANFYRRIAALEAIVESLPNSTVSTKETST